jgi:hypothetical protein
MMEVMTKLRTISKVVHYRDCQSSMRSYTEREHEHEIGHWTVTLSLKASSYISQGHENDLQYNPSTNNKIILHICRTWGESWDDISHWWCSRVSLRQSDICKKEYVSSTWVLNLQLNWFNNMKPKLVWAKSPTTVSYMLSYPHSLWLVSIHNEETNKAWRNIHNRQTCVNKYLHVHESTNTSIMEDQNALNDYYICCIHLYLHKILCQLCTTHVVRLIKSTTFNFHNSETNWYGK